MPRLTCRGAIRAALFLFLLVVGLAGGAGYADAATVADDEHSIGARLPIWSVTPFVGILLSIAFFPLFAPHWWHRHFPKVSVFWALLFAVPFLVVFRGGAIHQMLHTYFLEYIPFIILLWALFTISGGIYVKGNLRGTPGLNLILLLIGTAIASWIGTTGASMILIRPILKANMQRRHKVHVVIFFIFLVSNIGGALTPLGDPPLFLGFLLGVPFFWTMRLLPMTLFIVVPLLIAFYMIDRWYYRKEGLPPDTGPTSIRVEGLHNILFLLGVVGAVLVSGSWHPGHVDILGIHVAVESICREGFLLLMGTLSLLTTSRKIHEANGFSWFPIKEVGYLFAGIFMTIIPAISMLQAGESGKLAFIMNTLKDPSHYFFITGSLSAFLDNAPSYLTFFNSLLGKFYTGMPTSESVGLLTNNHEIYLIGVSLGAVYWGAVTYLGNAPNFMVKSICEDAGLRMPSFFGYMFKYSLPLLLPLFVLVTLVFL